jgi:hypothetical protein
VSWKQSWAENEGIMKIVAAVDGSEQSDAVVNEIIRRQFPPESELCVLSVVDPAYPALNSPNVGMDIQFIDTQSYDATQGAAHERARSAVDRAVAMLQATAASRHLAVTAKVLFGAPKDTILAICGIACQVFGGNCSPTSDANRQKCVSSSDRFSSVRLAHSRPNGKTPGTVARQDAGRSAVNRCEPLNSQPSVCRLIAIPPTARAPIAVAPKATAPSAKAAYRAARNMISCVHCLPAL